MTTPLELMDAMRDLYLQGRKVEAARLLPDLHTAVTGDAVLEMKSYPICPGCGGTAEIPHPSGEARKISCREVPDLCPGNGSGRMTPEEFEAFMVVELGGMVEADGTKRPPPPPFVDAPGLAAYQARRRARSS